MPEESLSHRIAGARPPAPIPLPTALATAKDAIVVEALEKTYPNGTKAVQGVSFRIKEGEFFGLLGPNGAGKSTTIGVLGTLVRPTKGRATVDGIDVAKDKTGVRKRIGFAMQEAGVDDLATGLEFLVLQAGLYGIPKATAKTRALELLRLFELEGAANQRIRSYSGGMKRRIDLASALIHLPKILFLDEPTEGLDPRSRQTMHGILKRLNRDRKTTVLLSTHYMDEADKLCDRIAIIDQGKIVALDTPANLKATIGGESVILEYGPLGSDRITVAEAAITKASLAYRMQQSGTELNCYVRDAAEAAPRILRALDAVQAAPQSLRIQKPTLDDVYLKYTGRKIQEAEAKPTNGGPA